jgi:hypothetical protein
LAALRSAVQMMLYEVPQAARLPLPRVREFDRPPPKAPDSRSGPPIDRACARLEEQVVQCKRNHFFAAAWLRLEGASRRSAMSLHLERIEVRTRFRSAAGKSSMTRRFIDHAIWASSIGADLTEVPRSLTFITA